MPDSIIQGTDAEFMPGAGFNQGAATALGNDVFNVAGRIENKLSDNFNSLGEQVLGVCSQIKGQYHGSVGLVGDEILSLCQRLRDKMERNERAIAGTMYGYWQNAGLPTPTADSVPYYVATGDALGAMGISPTLVGGSGNDAIAPTRPLPIPVGGIVVPQPTGGLSPVPPVPPPVRPPTVPPTAPGGIPPLSPPAGTVPPIGPVPPGQVLPGGTTCDPMDPNACPTSARMPDGSCEVMPKCPDGTCPPGFVGCGDYMQDCCNFPQGGPATPPTTPPTQPPTCPAGYQPDPSITFTQGTTTSTSWQPPVQGYGVRPHPLSTVPCQPQINSDSIYPTPGPIHQIPGGQYTAPWSASGLCYQFETCQSVDIDPCYFPAGYQGPTTVWFPSGWSLCIRPTDGWLVAGTACPDGFQAFDPTGSSTGQGPGEPGGQVPPGCVPVPQQQCKPAPVPQCGPDLNGTIPPIKLKDDDVCKSLDQLNVALGGAAVSLTSFIGMAAGVDQASGIERELRRGILGNDAPILPDLINRAVAWMQKQVAKSVDGLDCDKPLLLPISVLQAAFGLFDGWFGLVPRQLLENLKQMSNTACHVQMPSADQADKAWLESAITDAVWECWVKADGKRVKEQQAIRDGQRTRANVNEIFQLFRRENITEDTRNDLLRGQGVTDDSDRERLWKLTEQFPQFQDVIRFVVRDVFNETTVTNADMDNGFAQNYLNSEQGKKYGKAAGISDDLAKYFWRAHWQIPSYTMLREMLFRLRPGEVDDKLALSRDLMRQTLLQDDWAPAFVDRMIETAYLPINRTDFTRLYMDHIFDEDELTKKYMSVGYNEKDAQQLTADAKVRRKINDFRTGGFPSISQLVTMYSKCLIDYDTLFDGVEKQAVSQDQLMSALDAAELKRAVFERQTAVKTIQREYRLGLIDDATANEQLSKNGIDPGCVAGLVRKMRYDRQHTSKYLSASQLCKMQGNGIITSEQQLEALILQGWSAQDAQRIVAECNVELSQKMLKQLESAANKAAKAKAAADKAAAKAKTSSRSKASR